MVFLISINLLIYFTIALTICISFKYHGWTWCSTVTLLFSKLLWTIENNFYFIVEDKEIHNFGLTGNWTPINKKKRSRYQNNNKSHDDNNCATRIHLEYCINVISHYFFFWLPDASITAAEPGHHLSQFLEFQPLLPSVQDSFHPLIHNS